MDIYKKPITFAEVIVNDMREVQDEIIREAVEHLIGSRSREIEDEPRYLIGNDELRKFKRMYAAKMIHYRRRGWDYTKSEDLRIGIVQELSYHNEPYYEVCRKVYYEKYPEYFFS